MRVHVSVGDHPVYDSMVENPPEGFVYEGLADRKQEELTVYKKRRNILRRLATTITSTIGVPRMNYFHTNADLIHTSRGIVPLNRSPWVMDIEHAKSFFDSHRALHRSHSKRIVRRFLVSDNCRHLMPHCDIAGKSLVSAFGDDIADKLTTVYPAIEPRDLPRRKERDSLTLLFIANKFFPKGGREVLEAYEKLIDSYDLELIFKCKAPEEYKKKYEGLEGLRFVEDILPYDVIMNELYGDADVFLFPSYIDTFGFALLEAMSMGVPVVAANTFAIPEIVDDGKTGLLVDAERYDWAGENGLMKPEYVRSPEKRLGMYPRRKEGVTEGIIEKVSALAEDSRLRKRMGRKGRKTVTDGRFSIEERNSRLKKIYEEAVA